ncbi:MULTISPECIES: hypothetical protein [unclassified Methylobacterium]|jgi:hypothetical protein|uniref:hypothetical protein n=1 Tax=unclassified Methylobacterium TaxID=2615210 RepID=UPI0006FFCE29|nr:MULTISPECIES: hypothetical protein [unclassified Methylobacterium]KQO50410.1 hypothetical protein ASF24_23300 [Methylobacterium sp. Leaf86]KQO91773.1 hypothetical protein ASF32_22130 [Methylobacterium sp. Leaf91]MBO1020162.1 hypothetical protein [Methylobacterium sp. SD274]
MTLTKKLARVLTDETAGGYRLTIETVDGEIFRILATEDQVNDLIDELDELVGDDADDIPALSEEEERVGEEQPS